MSKNINKMPSNKKFGKFFSFIFFLFFLYFIFTSNLIIGFLFLLLSAIILTISILASNYLRLLNIIWFKVGVILNYFISPLVLSIIFFGLITPLSLILKLFKRDELKLKIKNDKSNWKIYEKNKLIDNHFNKQF